MEKRSARSVDQYSLFRITSQTSITPCLAEDGFKVFHECACPFISVLNMERLCCLIMRQMHYMGW